MSKKLFNILMVSLLIVCSLVYYGIRREFKQTNNRNYILQKAYFICRDVQYESDVANTDILREDLNDLVEEASSLNVVLETAISEKTNRIVLKIDGKHEIIVYNYLDMELMKLENTLNKLDDRKGS